MTAPLHTTLFCRVTLHDGARVEGRKEGVRKVRSDVE